MTAGLHQCAHDKEGTFILKGQTAAYSLDDEQSKKKKKTEKNRVQSQQSQGPCTNVWP